MIFKSTRRAAALLAFTILVSFSARAAVPGDADKKPSPTPAPAEGKGKAPVVYRCVGFDEPLAQSPVQVGKGRVLPLRAKLAGPGDKFGDDAALKAHPMIQVTFRPESGPEVDKNDSIEVRDYGAGKHFVFDKEAHWKFDLGTNNFDDEGKYKVVLLSGDEAEYKVEPACTLIFNLHI